MPPVGSLDDIKSEINKQVAANHVMVFSKKTCPFCLKVKDLFKSLNVEYTALEIDTLKNVSQYGKVLQEMTGRQTVPNIFIGGKYIGGCDEILKLHAENKLLPLIQQSGDYDYDLIVIGGGSGGLAAAKEAAGLGKKVALLDFVQPSPKGTSWGLGGTCVNVGCIPKKLMHRAALLGEEFHDSNSFGWDTNADGIKHKWNEMVQGIQDHIGSLNWNYRVQLRDKDVNYVNAYGEFIGPHKIKATNKRGKVQEMTAQHFIVATGERPRYPDIEGVKEFAITSDDLFSLPYCPGKTLCVGASYVSLECAGFLAGLGLDVTVMVRSILLRGFDQQMAEKIGDAMAMHKVNFIRGAVPCKIEKLEDGEPGKYRVTSKRTDGRMITGEYNTILYAIGRDPCTSGIGLETVGVKINPKNGRVIVDDHERTSVPHIYAVGDILDARLQLTPVAIQAGRLLVQRLYSGSTTLCDYINVPTTVFTPVEYGSIGYSEEAAIEKFGIDNLEVYHTTFFPLEWTLPKRDANTCYAKLICHIPEKERVIGFHVLSPNAGEITQGYAIAMKKGATKADFDNTIGIHPTCSETFMTLSVTKRSGEELVVGGC
ncbi:thioredoxin reductase 1, cytoplasmic-like [Gigantopelta aegis]|uniref:thioredoxin reductase 1, cytoplasmic-like n=1 Tax=Gigantopelta aegis TaxID=1735272 RepID=UPI001B88B08E|nr:thioredoxin reductase 1, cytoplasmic-like [Gigantopelta aegis]XP_041347589.1 thioredoxin reductase 1, cytoplasmic-like [Gigantopelta aegis]